MAKQVFWLSWPEVSDIDDEAAWTSEPRTCVTLLEHKSAKLLG